MNIRKYDSALDLAELMRVHAANGLPAECFPELVIVEKSTGRIVENPIYLIKEVVEEDGKPVVAGFIKLTSEAYLILDHAAGTPEQRWDWLQALASHVSDLAYARGLDEITAWCPPELLPSFEKRLEDLGFVRSPWVSFTKKLT